MKRSEMVDLIASLTSILPNLKMSKAEASVILSNIEKAGMLPPGTKEVDPAKTFIWHVWEDEDE